MPSEELFYRFNPMWLMDIFGNRAAVFPLQRMGYDVVAVFNPGYGSVHVFIRQVLAS